VLTQISRYDVTDFSDVVIPLANAVRHPSVVAENQRRASLRMSVGSEATAAEKGTANPKTNGEKTTDDVAEFTIEQLRAEVEEDLVASGHDSAYDRKSKVINKAIQDIGMGRYQWELFCLCGFGWLADNLWLQTVALVLPSLSAEFGISDITARFTTLALFTGLCIGASFWGTISDIIGRRPAFNLTLFITSIFGIAVGGSDSWITVCSLYATLGMDSCFGV
jgi:hypothetical protein